MGEMKYMLNKLITALFMDYKNAGKAYNAALKLGYQRDEINLLMSEETTTKYGHNPRHKDASLSDEAIKGAGVGGALGVTTGAITGAIIAMGAVLAISGLSLVLSGPIAIALAGAGAGGIAGGLVGALINIGISEDHVKNCVAEIKSGGILIALTPHSLKDYKTLEIEWNNYGGTILMSK